MKKLLLLFLFISIFNCLELIAQNKYDLTLKSLKLDSISGTIPTYFTPGNSKIAHELQKTITDASIYYTKKLSKNFEVKLAVLDAEQWFGPPYGFIFYSDGWIFMNTGMAYKQFINVYGLENIYPKLDLEMSKIGVTANEMIEIVFKVYAIHELGHYIVYELSNAESPDRWTDEFIASYLMYMFYSNYDEKAWEIFELFSRVQKDEYQPKYASIADFNNYYGSKMGVKNYLWYHSNFVDLANKLYQCYGEELLKYYEDLFPKKMDKTFTTDEIILLLDENCNGEITNWVKELESKAKY